MPVVECTPAESRAIDSELWVDFASQRAIEDRATQLKEEGVWELARSLFTGAVTTRKRSLLSLIVSERVLPSGERAQLPNRYYFLRDPQDDRLVIAWGDVFEDTGGGRFRLRPYEPLPRYMPPDELERLSRFTSSAPAAEEHERFATLDLSN